MKPRTAGRRVLDGGIVVLLVVAAVAVWRTADVNRQYQAALQSTGPLADRTLARDRLVGTLVSLPMIQRSEDLGAGGNAKLVWVVDSDRCDMCFEDGTEAWNALAADTSLRRHVLVYGGGGLPGEVRRALRGTAITKTSREEVEEALGPLLPTTKLLVGGDGTVLLADSRTANSECGWSFEAQVGVLRGVLPSALIRSSQP